MPSQIRELGLLGQPIVRIKKLKEANEEPEPLLPAILLVEIKVFGCIILTPLTRRLAIAEILHVSAAECDCRHMQDRSIQAQHKEPTVDKRWADIICHRCEGHDLSKFQRDRACLVFQFVRDLVENTSLLDAPQG